ncbi:YifB family Mg chelatase-like AAA ATPase [Microlunatus phosphovorus]|nr:YifB family Mg chelatase-like AAA ATPase [Microlunatus phosphovorus]
MSLACAYGVALVGLDGRIVEVEAHTGPGLPRTILVGLPDTSLYEARDRCKAAVHSSGQSWPSTLLTINLSPATLPKQGSSYDLAIVAAVLAASDVIFASELRSTVLVGELGLDGRVRPVRGVLPATLAAVQHGFQRVIVPYRQAAEAQLVEGIDVLGVASLAQLIALLAHEPVPDAEPVDLPVEAAHDSGDPALDLADVAGQLEAKWAVEVAAAGRHHLMFTGPPGVGKTMIAARLPGLLPELTIPEALEVSAIHSLAGFDLTGGLIRRPPYADPHHSASMASLIGGGAGLARPGAVSVAHRGVLFLDEAAEFSPKALEALRTPLESGEVNLHRSHGMTRYPARFQLVLAANPCPCGQAGTAGASCVCPPMAIRRYATKLSAPIRDRVDITQHFRPLKRHQLQATLGRGEPSAAVAARVAEARERQWRRLAGTGWHANSEVTGAYLRHHLPQPDGLHLLDRAAERGLLSPRGIDKAWRVSWTIADLAGKDRPGVDEIGIALAMRQGDRLGSGIREVS